MNPYVLNLLDPDPSLFVLIRIWFRPSLNKNSKKNFNSSVLRLFYDFLSLKTGVNFSRRSWNQLSKVVQHLQEQIDRRIRMLANNDESGSGTSMKYCVFRIRNNAERSP